MKSLWKMTCAALLLLLHIAPARALAPDDWTPNEQDDRSYTQVKQQFKSSLDAYDYAAVFAALQQKLKRAPAWTGQEPVYLNLHRAFTVLNERFANFEQELADAHEQNTALNDFLNTYPTGMFQFPCVDRSCFRDDFTVGYDALETLPDAQAEDFLYRLSTLNRLLADFKQPALAQTLSGIRKAKTRWEVFMREGMSQYPWEAALNGWLIGADDIQRPPARQWILLHPELGVEVSTDGLKELRAKQSLAVEVLGHAWYRWRGTRMNWWGLSLLATLRDDMRPGVGVMAHYNKLVTLGLAWHDTDEDGEWFDQSPHLVLGIDLFRFAENRYPEYQQRRRQMLDIREKVLGR